MIHIVNKTKGKPPRLPFARIADEVMGEDYELSVAFIGSTRSRRLNRERRGKDYPANVLSFPLDDTSGELLIDLTQARREANAFGLAYRAFVGLLFVHGLLHLKGYTHGSKMERKERAVRTQFGI